ncbi:unnamed protein product [Euphydryas editha]|uniref:DDE-1 domain-containing protein n=1 Tax=Euphydryas editha TaxID=104508 RepID=A0AAU9TLG1_EUPED|nr:unnamed protein product [Euphydryas editha]
MLLLKGITTEMPPEDLTCNINVIELARENNLEIVSLPSHTTHKLQLLDKTFMGPLKTYYSEEIRIWIGDNIRLLSPYDVIELLGRAYLKVQTDAEVDRRCSHNSNANHCPRIANVSSSENDLVKMLKIAIGRMPSDNNIVIRAAKHLPVTRKEV